MRGDTRRRARRDTLVLLMGLLLGLAHEARSQCPNNAQLPSGATQWPSCACNAGFTNTSGLVNLARACASGGCTVTGISEYTSEGFSFSKLVNGNTQENSFAHTNTENDDWMMIDLEQTAFVNHVRIFNRPDYGNGCCAARLNNFQIRVGHSSTFSNNPACASGENWFLGSKNFSCVLSGRYLSIQQFNTQVMNLAELEVYGVKTSNLARACSAGNCPVTAISQLGTDWEAWRLVDGVTSSQGAHTNSASNDWVMIDMQQTVFVAMVRIYNRVDCCWDRLNNFQIRVGDSGTSAGSSNTACASNQPWFRGQKDFTCVLSGRYLTLQQFNSLVMNVAEVEVYGLKASEWCAACFAGTFKTATGSAACADCAAGKYQAAAVVTTNPSEAARRYSGVYANLAKDTDCHKSMLDSDSGWCSDAYTAGASSWMIIDLGSNFRVHGVVTQCRANANQCVTEMEVHYSLTLTPILTSDWLSARTASGSTRFFLPATYSSTLKTSSIFSMPVTARYIRIFVYAWTGHPSMRAGVLTLSTTVTDACADCGAGKYSTATSATVSATCVDCVTGKFSPTAASFCADCAAGKYQDAVVITTNPPEASRTYESVWDNGAPGSTFARSMLDSAAAWNFGISATVPEWMQIDLGSEFRIHGVVTQCRANHPQCPYQVEAQYSLSTSNFVSATTVSGTTRFFLPLEYSSTLKTLSNFSQPVRARYVRIVLHDGGGMRAGVLTSLPDASWNVCADCGAGKYSTATGATVASSCQSCPANSLSATGSDAATDCVCVAGFSGPDGGTCAVCVAGKYKANPGSAGCTDCLANSYHALTGRTAASDCQCNAGTRVHV